MRHQYLMIDSRGHTVAHGTSDDGLEKGGWEIQVDSGDIKRVLSHEYVSLVSSSEKVPAMEGRIIRRDGNIISVESVRRLGEDVRRNLRMPVRFESYLYPVSGEWKGRLPILGNDLSCGGISFFCARTLAEGEIVQIAVPITAQPLLLNIKVLRQRPSGEPIPLFAAAFEELVHEEEKMIREAVFSLQLSGTTGI